MSSSIYREDDVLVQKRSGYNNFRGDGDGDEHENDETISSCLCRICCSCSPLTRKILLVFLFFLLLAITIIGLFFGPAIATLVMNSKMILASWKTPLFEIWQDTDNKDINIYRRYYFFNVTNPREVYWDRVKPHINAIGPFWFKTRRSRPFEYIYYDQVDDVNFRYHDYQDFVPEKSVDEHGNPFRLDYNITTMNMALFTAAYRVGKIPEFRVNISKHGYIEKQDICLLLDIEHILAEHRALGPKGIFTTHTVQEWLFGYQDPTLQMLHDGSKIIDYHVPTFFHLQFNDSVPAPGPISFRHGQVCPLANNEDVCNDTLMHDSTVTSGRKWNPDTRESHVDIKHVGTMRKWAGNDRLWWFKSPEESDGGDCQRIRGTEGVFVGTNVEKTSHPEIFVDGMFRSVSLSFMRDSNVQGIKTMRFGVDPIETNLESKNRKCYNQDVYGSYLNMSQVAFAPGFVSAKLFYPMKWNQLIENPVYSPPHPVGMFNFSISLPPQLRKGANRRNKQEQEKYDVTSSQDITDILRYDVNEEEYSSHLDIHPLTGSTLDARSLMQINTFLSAIRIPGCKDSFMDMKPQVRKTKNGTEEFTSYFPETAMPMLLVDRIAEAPGPIVAFLKASVETPLLVMKVIGWLGLASMIIIVILVLVSYFRSRLSNSDSSSSSSDQQKRKAQKIAPDFSGVNPTTNYGAVNASMAVTAASVGEGGGGGGLHAPGGTQTTSLRDFSTS